MVPIRRSQVKFYRDVPLFTKVAYNQYTVYKPTGIYLKDMDLSEESLPPHLFIRKNDRLRGIKEIQQEFNRDLAGHIKNNDPVKVKETMTEIVEEALLDPKTANLEGLGNTVDTLLTDYAKESKIVQNILRVSVTDYTTALHSINVMAYAIEYGYFTGMKIDKLRTLGLAALLHDVGKVAIDPSILKAPRKLSNHEFEQMKKHPAEGHRILEECRFDDEVVSLCALEHHEKLDGSGYPEGKTNISEQSMIVAILDCFEALTNDSRPYRRPLIPIRALKILKKDVDDNKFSNEIFESFCYSLVALNGGKENGACSLPEPSQSANSN